MLCKCEVRTSMYKGGGDRGEERLTCVQMEGESEMVWVSKGVV